jgi:hypothetical protein
MIEYNELASKGHLIAPCCASILIYAQIGSNSQISSFDTNQNLSSLKVDDLSDEQIISFKKQMLNAGYKEDQLEMELSKRKSQKEAKYHN